jgi:hypothetical protein
MDSENSGSVKITILSLIELDAYHNFKIMRRIEHDPCLPFDNAVYAGRLQVEKLVACTGLPSEGQKCALSVSKL